MRTRDRNDATLPWAWALGGALVVLVGLGILLAAAGAWRDRGAYRRGTPCAGEETQDCLREMGAVVERTYVRRRRLDDYSVGMTLDEPRFAHRPRAGWVELPDPEPVFDALRPGLRVRVTLWDGRVARVAVEGVGTVETDDSPLTSGPTTGAIGLVAVSWGAFAVVLGGSARRNADGWFSRGPAGRPWRGPGAGATLVRGLLAVGTGSVAVFLATEAFDVFSPVPLAATLAGVTGGVWALAERKARS